MSLTTMQSFGFWRVCHAPGGRVLFSIDLAGAMAFSPMPGSHAIEQAVR
ncbi:MAG TPA: hypothetical protein VGL82_09225 [Bryobacteraceae bacterium]